MDEYFPLSVVCLFVGMFVIISTLSLFGEVWRFITYVVRCHWLHRNYHQMFYVENLYIKQCRKCKRAVRIIKVA